MAINRFQAPDDATMQAIKARGMPQSNRAPGPLGWPALSMASGAVTPAFQSGPMQPRAAVESFDLGGGGAPSRSMVTGDRSLTRNPSGRAGLPLPQMGEQIGSRGMTDQRRSEMAGRRLSSAMRGGDMRATETLFRAGMGMGFGPRGYGPPQGFGPPQRPVPMGQPLQPSSTIVNNGQPLQTAPLMPPPVSTEQALGMPGFGSPAAGDNQPPPLPMASNMPWQGQPLPGGVPMRPAFAPMPWEPQQTFDTTQPLPPSTMMGGNGLPPPPEYSEQQVGGFNVLTGPDGKGGSKFLNAYTDPNRGGPPPLSAAEMGRIRSAGMQPTQVGGRMFDAQGVPYLEPLPQAPVPTERVTEKSPDGATTRTYTQPRGTQANPPAGEGGGNYFDSLLPAAPTASTQTGQMPNEAYAAPLSPEQMLEEARAQYLAGDKGAALQQYFEQFPSAERLAIMQPTAVTPRSKPVVADADKRRAFFTETELELARLQREALNEQEGRRSGLSRLSGRLARGAEKGFVQMGQDIANNASAAMEAVQAAPMAFDRAMLPLRQVVGPAVNDFFYGQPGTGSAQKALEEFQRMNRR